MWDPLLMAVVLRSSEFPRQLGAVDVGVQLAHGAQHDHLRRKYPITHAHRCETTGLIVLHKYLAHKYRCQIYCFIHIWNREWFNYSRAQLPPKSKFVWDYFSCIYFYVKLVSVSRSRTFQTHQLIQKFWTFSGPICLDGKTLLLFWIDFYFIVEWLILKWL